MNEHQHLVSAFRFHLWGYDYVIWPSEVIGLAMAIFAAWAFWHAHNSRKNPLDMGEMFVWPGTHHTSLAMVMAFFAAMVSLWVVIDQELKNKLDNTFALGVLGMLILGKFGTEAVNAWRSKPTPPPVSPSPTPPAVAVVQQNPPPAPTMG